MNHLIIILDREKALSFNCCTDNTIDLVNSLRGAYTNIDMPKMLNDFVFNIEVELQNAGVLDEWFSEVAP